MAPPIVTYSPAFTLVPTYECFNRCTYCNFRQNPGQSPWLSLETAQQLLQPLQAQGICEILLLSGEVHPQSPRRSAWVSHLVALCQLALSMGFLPHTNAGPLSFAEMQQLQAVNVSMGLMLEQMTPRLLATVHRHAPSKVPGLRLQQLEWAGQLGIPFTTGLLLGLGETRADRQETLEAIAQVQAQWGHIQEVILQPYSPGTQEDWHAEPFDLDALVETVALARALLPDSITLQVPPNLIHNPADLQRCLLAGVRDLGGIVPRDHVNPDYVHVSLGTLQQTLESGGWQLLPRLPIYPHLDAKLAPSLYAPVQRWRQRSTSG